MLMEAMRLSLLDQDRSAGGSSAPSANAPAATSRFAASNSGAPSPRSGTNPLPASTSDDNQRRRGITSTLAVPLANASNLIAMSTAGLQTRDSNSNSAETATTPEHHASKGGSSSAISSLRERLSSQSSSHRRVDSNPPPSTTLAAAIHANQTANAFLHPRSSETMAEATESGTSGASGGESTPSPTTVVPESTHERKDHQVSTGPLGEDSTLAH